MVPRILDDLDDIDKLLEIANTPKERKVKPLKSNSEIDEFISILKITSGSKRIPSSIIYYQYYLWKKIRLIDRRKFLRYFQTKFEKTRTDHGIGFLLNPKPFDLSPRGFFKARAFLRKEKDEKAKNKTK